MLKSQNSRSLIPYSHYLNNLHKLNTIVKKHFENVPHDLTLKFAAYLSYLAVKKAYLSYLAVNFFRNKQLFHKTQIRSWFAYIHLVLFYLPMLSVWHDYNSSPRVWMRYMSTSGALTGTGTVLHENTKGQYALKK